MPLLHDAVPEADLDYEEILRRGGANCGDEDFALCKCPHCARVYLIEYEADTLYLDATDLTRRVGISMRPPGFDCEGCGRTFPTSGAWIGPNAPASMQVTWKDLEASPWRWVCARLRGPRPLD